MKNLFGFGGNSVIIINNKGINDLDFNYWMNNQLTDDNIEEILEGSDLVWNKKFLKVIIKILGDRWQKERWYSLEEAAYIINGNYFSIYEEDSKSEVSQQTM